MSDYSRMVCGTFAVSNGAAEGALLGGEGISGRDERHASKPMLTHRHAVSRFPTCARVRRILGRIAADLIPGTKLCDCDLYDIWSIFRAAMTTERLVS